MLDVADITTQFAVCSVQFAEVKRKPSEEPGSTRTSYVQWAET